jgi:hypothetical protein
VEFSFHRNSFTARASSCGYLGLNLSLGHAVEAGPARILLNKPQCFEEISAYFALFLHPEAAETFAKELAYCPVLLARHTLGGFELPRRERDGNGLADSHDVA